LIEVFRSCCVPRGKSRTTIPCGSIKDWRKGESISLIGRIYRKVRKEGVSSWTKREDTIFLEGAKVSVPIRIKRRSSKCAGNQDSIEENLIILEKEK